jgi:hypothetical protein
LALSTGKRSLLSDNGNPECMVRRFVASEK